MVWVSSLLLFYYSSINVNEHLNTMHPRMEFTTEKMENNKMNMEELSNEPFPETDTLLEVKKGTLVLLHGRLPHYSCENTSPNSRHAYTIHVIDQNNDYPDWNWLQRPNLPLKSFIND